MASTQRLAAPWGMKDAVLFIVGWTVLPVVVIVLLFRAAPVSLDTSDVRISFGLLLTDSVLGLGLIYYFARKYRAGWRDLGLRGFSWWRSVLWLLMALVMFWLAASAAYWVLDALVPSFNPDQEQINEFTQAIGTPSGRAISFVSLVLIPPFVEELIFRGFIFPAFIGRLGLWGAAILSSVLFGLAHFQFNISVYTLVLGLLLCMMYYKLGSIWPGIALHMINNALAFSALLVS